MTWSYLATYLQISEDKSTEAFPQITQITQIKSVQISPMTQIPLINQIKESYFAYFAAPRKCKETYGSSPTTQLSCGTGGI